MTYANRHLLRSALLAVLAGLILGFLLDRLLS